MTKHTASITKSKMNSKRNENNSKSGRDNKSSSSSSSTNSSKRTRNNNRNNKDVTLSKALSWITRHGATKINLAVSEDGYIPVQCILESPARNMNKLYTIDDVIRVVESNDKQRFKLCNKDIRWVDRSKSLYSFDLDATCEAKDIGKERQSQSIVENVLCIRANQGHSIEGIKFEELLQPITKEELANMNTPIIHGTNMNAWEQHIKHEGLNKMKRNHIHFASGLPKNKSSDDTHKVISGMRTNSEIYIYVNGAKCAEDGIKFYRSTNGVILTAGLNEEEGVLPVEYFLKVINAKTGRELNT